MTSPYFSSFRELMDKWDKTVSLFKENDLCLFFKKDGILYGATETGRITYARMRSPESKEDEAWKQDATFVAYDLTKSADGSKSMSVFNAGDLKKIKMIDQEQAEKELKEKGKTMPVISDEDEEQTYGEE
jgi:hypothetical protein